MAKLSKKYTSQGLDNQEHDKDYSVKKIAAFGWDGSNMVQQATDSDGHLQVDVLSGAGSATEYTDNDAVATPSGSVSLGHDGSNVRVLATDSDGDLQVDVKSGTVIANAGTNLNTSALALETGGNLATIAGDTTSLDGKVTACNTGNVTVGSALPAGTNLIGNVKISDGTETANVNASNQLEVNVNSASGLEVVQGTAADLNVTEANSTSILADTANIDTNVGTLAGAVSGSEMQVDVVGSLPAGTNAIGKLAANSGVDIGDVDVTSCNNTAGDVAHDSADSGNPIKVGGKAYNQDGSAPGTAVTEGDRANFITDVYGRQFVETAHPNLWSATADYSSVQTNTEIEGAPGAGLSLYITDIIVSNGATAGQVKFVEDTTSAVDKVENLHLAANGGAVMNFRTPIKLTTNKNLGVTSTTAGDFSVTVNGFIAP